MPLDQLEENLTQLDCLCAPRSEGAQQSHQQHHVLVIRRQDSLGPWSIVELDGDVLNRYGTSFNASRRYQQQTILILRLPYRPEANLSHQQGRLGKANNPRRDCHKHEQPFIMCLYESLCCINCGTPLITRCKRFCVM